MATKTAYHSLIDKTAQQYGLDTDLLAGLVWIESRGWADAFRYEEQYAQRYHIADHPVYKQWPVRSVAASYGLTQIMVPTAYELGWRDPCPEYLFIPEVNLFWGAAYLHECFKWANQWATKTTETQRLVSALAAYNGGRNSANSPLLPTPKGAGYAARVIQAARELA